MRIMINPLNMTKNDQLAKKILCLITLFRKLKESGIKRICFPFRTRTHTCDLKLKYLKEISVP